jgi:hypothetical protein
MPTAALSGGLAEFQKLLIGTWSNQAIGSSGKGGEDNPLSYNVMPLPQATSPSGYILKNFSLYENLIFNNDKEIAPPTSAPNRGAADQQVPTALYYAQQVFFAEGPGKGNIVHTENGAWLNLQTAGKTVGPYGTPAGTNPVFDNPNKQPSTLTIAKQMSIPHGNSILALGTFDGPSSSATVPNAAPIFPSGTPALNTTQYTTELSDDSDYQNPNPAYTQNVNAPIQEAYSLIAPNQVIHWHVTTSNQGNTMDIPFEQRVANVFEYSADYWLLSNDGGSTYPHLIYSQNISMKMSINGVMYTFPHITSNCLTKQS